MGHVEINEGKKTLFIGQLLINFIIIYVERKMRVEREVVIPNKFTKRWMKVKKGLCEWT